MQLVRRIAALLLATSRIPNANINEVAEDLAIFDASKIMKDLAEPVPTLDHVAEILDSLPQSRVWSRRGMKRDPDKPCLWYKDFTCAHECGIGSKKCWKECHGDPLYPSCEDYDRARKTEWREEEDKANEEIARKKKEKEEKKQRKKDCEKYGGPSCWP